MEDRELDPAQVKFGRWRFDEAAYIRADEGHARSGEPLALGVGHVQVLPRGDVVAGPAAGEALRAGVGRAGDGEGAPALAEASQALLRRADHLHAVDIVRLAVRARVAVVVVPDIVREGPVFED